MRASEIRERNRQRPSTHRCERGRGASPGYEYVGAIELPGQGDAYSSKKLKEFEKRAVCEEVGGVNKLVWMVWKKDGMRTLLTLATRYVMNEFFTFCQRDWCVPPIPLGKTQIWQPFFEIWQQFI